MGRLFPWLALSVSLAADVRANPAGGAGSAGSPPGGQEEENDFPFRLRDTPDFIQREKLPEMPGQLELPLGLTQPEQFLQPIELPEKASEEPFFPGDPGLLILPQPSAQLSIPTDDRLVLTVSSASKHEESVFWSPSAVTVLTRKEIAFSGARTLADLLRRVAGMDVYQVKPYSPLVGIRSLTDLSNNRVLLLVDGREDLIELIGFSLWSVSAVDLEEIERVEIIRGPGSTLYGANAFTGVVSVTTLRRGSTGGDGYATLDEKGGRRLFARMRGELHALGQPVSWALSASEESAPLPSVPGSAQHRPIRLQGTFAREARDRWQWSVQGGYHRVNGDIYTQAGDTDVEAMVHFVMGQAQWTPADRWRLKMQLYSNRTAASAVIRSRIFRGGLWLADFPPFSVDTHTGDLQLQVDYEVPRSLYLVAGAALRRTDAWTEHLTPSRAEETRGAAFVQVQWKLLRETLQLVGGLRADANSVTEEALSPRLTVVFRPLERHAFRLGYAVAFRKPFFLEHSMHFDFEAVNPVLNGVFAPRDPVVLFRSSLGTPGLRNERVQGWELGWLGHLREGRLQVALDGYYYRFFDTIYINSVTTEEILADDADPQEQYIFGFINTPYWLSALGGELALNWRPKHHVALWGNWGLRKLYSRHRGGEVKWSLDTIDEYEPRWRFNAGVRYGQAAGWVLDAAVHGTARHRSLQYNTTDFEYWVNDWHPPSWLGIFRLGYRLPSRGPPWPGLEAGLTLWTPLGPAFRENNGYSTPAEFLSERTDPAPDFGGERWDRMASVYLRLTL